MALGKEDLIHKDFAKRVNEYTLYNQLNCIWWSYDASGEYRKPVTAGLLKKKGLNGGRSDYSFYYKIGSQCYILFIEFKSPVHKGTKSGGQSPNQKVFQEAFQDLNNVDYHICYSVEEAEVILKSKGIIK